MDNIDDGAETIFRSALRIAEPEARERYITDSCRGDETLEQRIRVLLIVTSENTSSMETAAAETRAVDFVFDNSERVGSIIGPYEMIGLIGSGGMGLVFLAQQNAPVRRQVALKIIRPGMDDRDGIRRFKAERQTLAHLNHPGIARLLDAGTTSTHRPWFAMELAQGLPITDFCQKNRLPLNERLRLFQLVCEAVVHAHQHGVLHRDLKPANILVTEQGGRYVPKVIDFGVARVSPDDKERQRHGKIASPSQPEAILGTPAYMSPEQTYMPDSDLDARSDVYSLGILLYKLLTDFNAFHGTPWRQMDYFETRRTIHEVTPSIPSEQILAFASAKNSNTSSSIPNETEIADNPQRLRTPLEWRMLSANLKGDLDWITMKAIEKNRNRRYESVEALIADIQRHLRHEPVEASPLSHVYRIKKLLRRRTFRLVFLMLILCLMLLLSLFLIIGRMLLYEREESEKFRQLVRDGNPSIEDRDKVINSQNYATEMQTGFVAYFRGNVNRARESVERFSAGTDSSPGVGFEWHYLNALCHDSSHLLIGDNDNVFDVRFSPDEPFLSVAHRSDGRQMAILDAAGTTVSVHSTADGAILQKILAPQGVEFRNIVFSADDQALWITDAVGKLFEFNLETTELTEQPLVFNEPVSTPIVSADGRFLGITSIRVEDRIAAVWDIRSKQELFRVPINTLPGSGGSRGVPEIRGFPDNQTVISSNDVELHQWDFQTKQKTLPEFPPQQHGIEYVLSSPDRNTLLVGLANADVYLVDRVSRKSVGILPGMKEVLQTAAFSQDGRTLATATRSGTIQLWHVSTRQAIYELPRIDGQILSMWFTADGTCLFAAIERGSGDREIVVWDASGC